MMTARWKRVLIGLSAAAGVVMLSAPASAHVTIDTFGDVEAGGFAKLGFSVPNEREDAGTVALEVQFPPDHPLVFVSVQAKPGWTVETTTRTLSEPVEAFGASYDTVVDTVSWTADEGVRIEPGQFDMFWVSAGPMPDAATALEFPALQTYDDGEVVRWIEPTPVGGEEPEHPAPSVVVAPGVAEVAEEAEGGHDHDDDDTTLELVALSLGAMGVLVGGWALVSHWRREHAAPS
jgi:uncharacterized protein YcnI